MNESNQQDMNEKYTIDSETNEQKAKIKKISPSISSKAHAFNGAVLAPKHARELTPNLVLNISIALAESCIPVTSNAANSGNRVRSNTAGTIGSNQQNHAFRRASSNPTVIISSSMSGDILLKKEEEEKLLVRGRIGVVQYTVWITEAWRILNWAEPSAALFWEMATMYHTLFVASRSIGEEIRQVNHKATPDRNALSGGSSHIPPILSCGSASSHGSTPAAVGITPATTTPTSPTTNTTSTTTPADKKKKHAPHAAKELPVWLLSMFLLMHCESQAYARSVSGEDERRFDMTGLNRSEFNPNNNNNAMNNLDVNTLLMHPSLSPRTRIHAGHHTSNVHCCSFLLRHLRKFLLFASLPSNTDILHRLALNVSSMKLKSSPKNSTASMLSSSINAKDINSKHDIDHGTLGNNVVLTSEEIERLTFLFHTAPQGGLIDEPPLKMNDFFHLKLSNDNTSTTTAFVLADIENVLRQELEKELHSYMKHHLLHSRLASTDSSVDYDDMMDDEDYDDYDDHDDRHISQKLTDLSLKDDEEKQDKDLASSTTSSRSYSKELTYKNLSGTTILLKPYLEEKDSTSASSLNNAAIPGRLHDVTIVDCSDAHMYLLQPFEHATISGCTGCTIVVGAVAGLLNVVDCERTTISSAARRILVWNSFDVLNCCFTPSPPLLVGDVRSCQFAPYNTYYDGLREDLLSTGLAAAVLDQNNNNTGTSTPTPSTQPSAANSTPSATTTAANSILDASPALQCASNKWKLPVELSKLEIPHVMTNSLSFDGGSSHSNTPDKDPTTSSSNSVNDDSLLTPIILPASEFHILFIPYESKSAKIRKALYQQKQQQENSNADEQKQSYFLEESQYCRNLESILQLCPFRLPIEYERRIFVKVERMRSLQTALQTDLTVEQQALVEDELNLGFREWLVSSGNLRQVLDLVHLERTTNAENNIAMNTGNTATS